MKAVLQKEFPNIKSAENVESNSFGSVFKCGYKQSSFPSLAEIIVFCRWTGAGCSSSMRRHIEKRVIALLDSLVIFGLGSHGEGIAELV